ncbi:MAG: hypothetical protein MJZ48_02295 [Paludibacteraceae bacterium]|nr:hypothetical protein [Paludibacteraceae bacterium]
MENRDYIKRLNRDYYGMLVVACVCATAMYLLITKNILLAIPPLTPLGQAIQYMVIIDALATIPFGLWWHKRTCKRLMSQEDNEARTQAYCRSARLRIYLVSNVMVLGIVAFYLLGAYQSMIWVAGIGAIGWYFTKPTEKKMFMELQPETY